MLLTIVRHKRYLRGVSLPLSRSTSKGLNIRKLVAISLVGAEPVARERRVGKLPPTTDQLNATETNARVHAIVFFLRMVITLFRECWHLHTDVRGVVPMLNSPIPKVIVFSGRSTRTATPSICTQASPPHHGFQAASTHPPHKPEESIFISSGWKTNRQVSRQARSYCTAGLRATPSSLAARITKCGSRKNSRASETMSAFPSTNTKFACFAVVISPTAPTQISE